MNLSKITNNYIGNINIKELLNNSQHFNIDNINSMIVPHAGYYFSGEISAIGYNQLKNKLYDNVFIIATSHKSTFYGARLLDDDNYFDININTDINFELDKYDIFNIDMNIFKDDHNLEIHLPFIKEVLPKSNIIPIMIGETNKDKLIEISNILSKYFNKKNLFIISSDLSHYPSYNDSLNIDFESIETIQSLNIDKFFNFINKKENINKLVTKMCGWSSILILINILIKQNNISSKLLKYKNSGHITGNKKDVVGYSSIIFYKKEKIINLTYEDKINLLKISRTTLNSYVLNKTIKINDIYIHDNLKEHYGCFVTLKNNEITRGCIGLFEPNYPLFNVIKDVTISSYNDDRFDNITKDELLDINIEISILTPFIKIKNINEIEIGKHGIFLEKNGKSSTFLPQVIEESNWGLEEALGNCAIKGGMDWDDWKESNIFIYESIIFDEKQMFKEALFYEKLKNKKVKCNLCPFNCIIPNGKIGQCLSRKNINGILYSTVYNNPSIIGAIDPIEKKPLKYFNPGKKIYSLCTNGCNFHCDNCQNFGISQKKPSIKDKNLFPMEIIKDCINRDLDMIAFTYTEPTIYYEYMLDIAKLSKNFNIKTVLVSNGYINEKPLKELLKYIDAANIDLKFFNNEKHKKITKGELNPVLNTIRIIHNSNVHLEISNLIIEGLNDNENEIKKMYQWMIDNNMKDVPVHLLSFFPTYKMTNRKNTSSETIEKIRTIAKNLGIKYI